MKREGAGSVLEVSDLEVLYGDSSVALRGLALRAPRNELVAILGPNGAGKTTLLRAVTGSLGFHRGRVAAGEVLIEGQSVIGRSVAQIVARGVGYAMEGRRLFVDLSVRDNLVLGGTTVRDRRQRRERLEQMFDLFPALRDRSSMMAGYLSGGEQQMLAIARALMGQPSLLLLDEPSLGLSPAMVDHLGEVITGLRGGDLTVVLVEQNAELALSIADHAYVVEDGRVALEGPASELQGSDAVRSLYLGGGGPDPAAELSTMRPTAR